jgi:hypothetical protein
MKFTKITEPSFVLPEPGIDPQVLAVIRDYFGDPEWSDEVDDDLINMVNKSRREVGAELARMKGDALPAAGSQRTCPKCAGKRLGRRFTEQYFLGHSMALFRMYPEDEVRLKSAGYHHYAEVLTVDCSCGFALQVEQTADWPSTRNVWTVGW